MNRVIADRAAQLGESFEETRERYTANVSLRRMVSAEDVAAMVAFRAPDYPSRIAQPVLMLAAGGDIIVSAAAIEAFAARLPAGSYRLIAAARHEILQEQDGYRAQFWQAFDAFVPGSVLPK